MNQDTKLKKAIMRRVYAIYCGRLLMSGAALRLYALIVLSAGLYSVVSVRDVVANAPGQGIFAFYDFSMYAFMHTEVLVQMMLFGAVAAGAWIARDIIRGIIQLQALRRAI